MVVPFTVIPSLDKSVVERSSPRLTLTDRRIVQCHHICIGGGLYTPVTCPPGEVLSISLRHVTQPTGSLL